ncbi:hypothetical protein BV898_02051 [Hypsibius exemplaris]|uniref:Uncharacterized protein n=1 Tax=Hypsibius exemplaris TaxID=2072580 RepID=A0A1W0X9M3_HYPEX|nr:hypothetical protein BV898_02051 [Hypsibius exemplaris]
MMNLQEEGRQKNAMIHVRLESHSRACLLPFSISSYITTTDRLTDQPTTTNQPRPTDHDGPTTTTDQQPTTTDRPDRPTNDRPDRQRPTNRPTDRPTKTTERPTTASP